MPILAGNLNSGRSYLITAVVRKLQLVAVARILLTLQERNK